MARSRLAHHWPPLSDEPEVEVDYKHPVFADDQRNEAIERLLGDEQLDVENELELGYDPNDSGIRRLRY